MREFNILSYIFIYFSRVLNQNAGVKKQRIGKSLRDLHTIRLLFVFLAIGKILDT